MENLFIMIVPLIIIIIFGELKGLALSGLYFLICLIYEGSKIYFRKKKSWILIIIYIILIIFISYKFFKLREITRMFDNLSSR